MSNSNNTPLHINHGPHQLRVGDTVEIFPGTEHARMAQVHLAGGFWALEDLGSTRGIFPLAALGVNEIRTI